MGGETWGMYPQESIILLPPVKATIRGLAIMIITDKITREREEGRHDFLVADTKDSIVDVDHVGAYRERGGMAAWLKKT